MRTSLHEVAAIEEHLFRTATPPDQLLFEAKQIIDPSLAERVAAQKHAYQLVQQYGRKKLVAELEAVHQQLFDKPEHRSFADRIRRIFGF
jgi:hypothetical protein